MNSIDLKFGPLVCSLHQVSSQNLFLLVKSPLHQRNVILAVSLSYAGRILVLNSRVLINFFIRPALVMFFLMMSNHYGLFFGSHSFNLSMSPYYNFRYFRLEYVPKGDRMAVLCDSKLGDITSDIYEFF